MGGEGAMNKPFFSIVLPIYNRETFVGRALRSCLAQDFQDFEIIVIDDGSTDRSVEKVLEFKDDRIVLLRHERNRGQCEARNTGMEKVRGEWIVFLDSDDELLPGALTTIHRRAAAPNDGVGRMLFMCRFDTGGTSPDPPLPDEVWDYAQCLRWTNDNLARPTEAMPCVKADTFPQLRYHDGRVNEMGYHLDCAKAVRTRVCSDIVRTYYHDAPIRVIRPSPERMLEYAPDTAADMDRILRDHGEALRQWAPEFLMELERGASTFNFLAGRRALGVGHAIRYLRRAPLSIRAWSVMGLGLLSPRLLAYVKSRMFS
jgi:hypothetical protein